MNAPTVAALIAAGGTGERFGNDSGKQLALVAGRPVLAHVVSAFTEAESVGIIVLVGHPERLAEYESAVASSCGSTPLLMVPGGETRQESVAAGLAAIAESWPFIAVHDGARPLVTTELIDRMALELAEDDELDGLIVGHPAYDTLKQVDNDRITGSLDRDRCWMVQTPQVFRAPALRSAHAAATNVGSSATDDATLIEAAGGTLRVFRGPRDNIKITVAEDLMIAEAVLRHRGNG
ncbi:MAG: 2-C-methyl-D-erythritol 4-phosphate cytidylyltransferase [Actinomycetota bacterium]|nr:2-C-methyl-D-erythritol 4-phosphate cytidylyltransferase [Actinomycetota bacterium]